MILEAAFLQVRAGQSQAFESAFREAQALIASMPGYLSHELQRCLEREGEYLLLVRWESVAAHEEGFRKSPQYAQWRKLLHPFFACRNGRLKLREFADGTGQLIHYDRADDAGSKVSDYVIAPAADPGALREALTRGCGELGRVRKRRTLYLVDRTRIHLDRVEGLGDFLELEVVLAEGEPESTGHETAAALLRALGVAESQLVRGAYLDLLLGSR